jgi:hypothetical protein
MARFAVKEIAKIKGELISEVKAQEDSVLQVHFCNGNSVTLKRNILKRISVNYS